MVRFLVGQCHVRDSYTDVVRFVISKIKNNWKDIPREDRLLVIQQILEAHKTNRKVYKEVMC